ncbi:hypothetical protein RND81_08G038200 [Saponaria officinalis]|uniref:GTD-binding domain-containing protein n=1 Tax=Saponaria officinalis TaxID=3572 RepID=A0AAW1J3L3_SAPOF
MSQEIDFLKETLRAQQDLLQKLFTELDAERESSAIAADETLSMILRLQGEKAALEMEARQYKRIAEEKICHAHETLEIFQELVYQKELQIASLEFQVQAYKFKLAVSGCDDFSDHPDNMSFKRRDSLPPASSKRSSGDVNAYWEEIRKLDDRVKGFVGLNSLNPSDKTEEVLNVETCGESRCSSSVQDIFEVPTYDVSDNELEQFNTRLKEIKGEMFVTGDEVEEEEEEDVKLLRTIMKKVEALQSEVTNWRTKKPVLTENRSFGCFKEVMLCFLP